MLVKREQFAKIFESIFETDLGMTIEVKAVHPENALLPISVTESGITTDVKLEQSLKVPQNIFLIDEGISTEVKELHPEKAHSLIIFTESGMIAELNDLQF